MVTNIAIQVFIVSELAIHVVADQQVSDQVITKVKGYNSFQKTGLENRPHHPQYRNPTRNQCNRANDTSRSVEALPLKPTPSPCYRVTTAVTTCIATRTYKRVGAFIASLQMFSPLRSSRVRAPLAQSRLPVAPRSSLARILPPRA